MQPDIEDEDPAMVERMLLHLYTLKYPAYNTIHSLRLAKDLVIDAHMYALADKYDLTTLKRQVKEAFQILLNLILEHQRDERDDHEKEDFYGRFAEAAAVIYSTTPESDRGLRDLIKIHTWNFKDTLLRVSTIQRCVLQTDGYKDDLLQALFGNRQRR